MKRKTGKFNLVTGKVISFNNIAKQIINISGKKGKILYQKGPMPWSYRAFKNSRFEKVFPSFKFKILTKFQNIFIKDN